MAFCRGSTLAVAIALVLGAVSGCGGSDSEDSQDSAGASQDRFDAERAFDDLEAQVAIGPRPAGSAGGREEVRLITDRLREAGVEDIRVQRPWRNVVGVIPGEEPGAGGGGGGGGGAGAAPGGGGGAPPHDTKNAISPEFVGANDGASGVALVLELARVLEPPLDGPSIHLALFDAEETRGDRPFEEDGTRGSRQYVDYATQGGLQGSPPLDQIRAMVLFDLVGDCDLQIPREAFSDPDLYALFADAAAEINGSGATAPFDGETGGVLDDHIPFTETGIPAVDLIDFTYGPGGSPGVYWHTTEDTLDKVCPESLDAVGEAALLAIPRIR
jgi:glutaminyl-peptide cyclotransferase